MMTGKTSDLWALTNREEEVVRWRALGCSRIETAEHMNIEPITVGQHMYSITQKLGVTGRHIVIIALQLGIVTLDECVAALPQESKNILTWRK